MYRSLEQSKFVPRVCKCMGMVQVTVVPASCLHCTTLLSTSILHGLLQLQDPLQHVTLLCLQFPDNSFVVLPFSLQLVSLQQRLDPKTLTKMGKEVQNRYRLLDKNR